MSEGRLGLLYTVGVLPVVFFGELAAVRPGLQWLMACAAVTGLCALSILIAVIAFYRDDDPLLAGIILTVITGVGTGIAWSVATAVIQLFLGAVIVFAAVGVFAFCFGCSSWLRRSRGWSGFCESSVVGSLQTRARTELAPKVRLQLKLRAGRLGNVEWFLTGAGRRTVG